MSQVEDVRLKLQEYGIEIYAEYPMDDGDYCFQTEKMLIFVNEKESSICVGFVADMRPEDSSNYLLILNEIKTLKKIDITESYTFDENNQFITGEEAFDFVKKNIMSEMMGEYARQQTYNEILKNHKCFNC
jgi:hypothetical protein